MGLLDDILNAVKNPPDIETALLNCMRLGTNLKVPELVEWARNEHNGYPEDANLPPYRMIRAPLLGKYWAGSAFTGWLSIPDKPVGYIPEFEGETREKMETLYVREGVGQLAATPDRGEMAQYHSSRVAQIVNSHLSQGSCEEVYVRFPVGAYSAIRDNVRGKIVDFTLDLQQRFPDAELTPSMATPEVQANIREAMTRVDITAQPGSVVNVHAGSGIQNIAQNVLAKATVNDLESLMAALKDVGVDDQDLDELQAYLVDGEPDPEELEPDGKIGRWVGKAAKKAASTGGKLAFEAIKLIMIEIIKMYWFHTGRPPTTPPAI